MCVCGECVCVCVCVCVCLHRYNTSELSLVHIRLSSLKEQDLQKQGSEEPLEHTTWAKLKHPTWL